MKGETSMAGLRREETGSHDLDDDHDDVDDDHHDDDNDDEINDDDDNNSKKSTGCSFSKTGKHDQQNIPPKNISFFLSSKQCNESFP